MQAAAVAGLLVLLFILVINAKSRRAKVLPVIPKHPFLVTWPVHLPRVPYGWHASNASCFFFQERNWLLVRLVNYSLRDDQTRI